MNASIDQTVLDVDDLLEISKITAHARGWKPALDRIIRLIRPHFIFDNLALYSYNLETESLEILYARATGRGRRAEADASWGEALAMQVCLSGEKQLLDPPEPLAEDRLKQPYLLGVPILTSNTTLGAMVFIRFGGPLFTNESVKLAEFTATQIAALLESERRRLQEERYHAQDQAFHLQEDFIHTITHEIRNPLGFIKGYTTTLLRTDTEWDIDARQEFLRIIDGETDHLESLIDNLLDSARLQSGQMLMDFQIVRLDALINDSLQRAAINYPEMIIELKIPSNLPTISGDPSRLAQVFENILINSAKYAPGSPVEILGMPEEKGVSIQIVDHGAGVPLELAPRLFERFFRNPQQALSVHGTGLGLFICRQIILAHEGTIEAEATPGGGLTIKIWLPYHQAIPETLDLNENETNL